LERRKEKPFSAPYGYLKQVIRDGNFGDSNPHVGQLGWTTVWMGPIWDAITKSLDLWGKCTWFHPACTFEFGRRQASLSGSLLVNYLEEHESALLNSIEKGDNIARTQHSFLAHSHHDFEHPEWYILDGVWSRRQ
jgi:hypothetical protein